MSPSKTRLEAEDADLNRIYAAISYLGFLFLISMLVVPESKFAQFHARQGLIFFLFGLAVSALANIPVIGWFIIGPLGGIATLVFIVIGITNALAGQKQTLPFIGKLIKFNA